MPDAKEDFPKPTPPKDDIVAIDNTKVTATSPVVLPPPVATNDDLMTVMNNLHHELVDHKAQSKKRSWSLLGYVLAAVLLGVAGYSYQLLVIEPALQQAKVVQEQAKQEIENTKSLTKVLLESLAAQSKTLTKTVNGKLTSLGFQELPK